jgi:hypothetical protein
MNYNNCALFCCEYPSFPIDTSKEVWARPTELGKENNRKDIKGMHFEASAWKRNLRGA